MMQNKFTREFYTYLWDEILSIYRWNCRDLSTLLSSIGERVPIVEETFWKMYTKTGENLSINTLKGYKFYEILSRFMGNEEKLEVKTQVKALRKENELLQLESMHSYRRKDILVAILCFAQEFANKKADNINMSRYGNIMMAHSYSVDFYAERDKKKKVTYIRIIIPCELSIEYWICGMKNVSGIRYIVKKTEK